MPAMSCSRARRAKSRCAAPTYSSNIGATRRPPARRCATAGIAPATSDCATPTVISGCTIGRRGNLKIAVLGGGNGSFAAAGDFALQGHQVRLWRRDAAQVAEHRAAGSRVVVKDSNGRHDVQLAVVTTGMAEAVRDAELIL